MKKIFTFNITLLTIFAFSILISSCKKENKDEQTQTINNGSGTGNEETGIISGKVSTPRGRPVGFAAVLVGNRSTRTDHNGEFSLAIPVGNQNVTIQSGKGNIFKKQIPVNLSANQSFRFADTTCVLTQVGQMAFVPGNYDQIERIIMDSLGYSAVPIQTNMFGSPSYISQFDAIFLNCTANSLMQYPLYQNLDTFVQNGGSIYASDWAVEYLTGNGVFGPGGSEHRINEDHNIVNPQSTCSYPLQGGFVSDTSICTYKGGASGLITSVRIYDAGMIAELGKDSVDIYYDLGSWELVLGLDAPFVTTMEKVGYPGIVAAKSDMASYYSNAGTIIFTTFHNHPQSYISPDVMTLLEYFIMNL